MSGDLDPYRLPPNAVRQLSGLRGDDVGLVAPNEGRGGALAISLGLAFVGALVTALALVPACRWWGGGAIGAAIGFVWCENDSHWGWLEKPFVAASALCLVATGVKGWGGDAAAKAAVLGVAIALGTLAYVVQRVVRWRQRSTRQLHALYELQQAAERFDKLVQALGVADSVQDVLGQAPSEADRQRALQVLAINRDNLVRALRVERLLRENRKLLADVGAGAIQEALLPMEAVRIDARASEYARIVTENLAIAAEVQTAFDELTHAPARRR